MTVPHDSLVVLGPTASGKTALGAGLARSLHGEILSVDSRQVYRGLDIGSGKDLQEYEADGQAIPYHLIDIVNLDQEFNVFSFQQAFFPALAQVRAHGRLPIAVGGTGLYLDAVIEGYAMKRAPENPSLRGELAELSDEELRQRLMALRPHLHNSTDLLERDRVVRAIEVALAEREQSAPREQPAQHEPRPPVPFNPLILGTQWPREELRLRIATRLKQRLEAGLIEEVEQLHARGHSWERLELLGLEYRFVAQFLKGEINSRNDLFQKLHSGIAQFAKKQETWFRRMERRGHLIHWIPRAELAPALEIVKRHQWQT